VASTYNLQLEHNIETMLTIYKQIRYTDNGKEKDKRQRFIQLAKEIAETENTPRVQSCGGMK